jgi:predicted nucleic acid-binding protein
VSARAPEVVYWDTSAIVSALFADRHSGEASAAARTPGTHLVSSLGWAEVHAVIARIAREQALSPVLIAAAHETIEHGPWVSVSVDPNRRLLAALARAWPLRGADLWHLAAAKVLQVDLPELRLLSFDARLAEAARGEGFQDYDE